VSEKGGKGGGQKEAGTDRTDRQRVQQTAVVPVLAPALGTHRLRVCENEIGIRSRSVRAKEHNILHTATISDPGTAVVYPSIAFAQQHHRKSRSHVKQNRTQIAQKK
jgi:hypothetical protein